ncbi:MAG: hypothetical protein RLZZ490_1886 [Cyanobacteriota bacterium]
MLKKLFGGKNEFFVQLDENQTTDLENKAPDPAPEAVAAVSEPPAQPQKAAVKKNVKKSTKTAVASQAPDPTPVATPKTKLEPAQVAFASADPILQNIARRSPGPSLNKFKEMARQVKIR